MKEWKIVFAQQAESDLRNIYEYIAYSLLEPVIAKKQTGRIIKKIMELNTFPLRCPVFDASPWNNIGLRILLVDHYSILFLPDEMAETVAVVRIMYSGRDIETELSKKPILDS